MGKIYWDDMSGAFNRAAVRVRKWRLVKRKIFSRPSPSVKVITCLFRPKNLFNKFLISARCDFLMTIRDVPELTLAPLEVHETQNS